MALRAVSVRPPWFPLPPNEGEISIGGQLSFVHRELSNSLFSINSDCSWGNRGNVQKELCWRKDALRCGALIRPIRELDRVNLLRLSRRLEFCMEQDVPDVTDRRGAGRRQTYRHSKGDTFHTAPFNKGRKISTSSWLIPTDSLSYWQTLSAAKDIVVYDSTWHDSWRIFYKCKTVHSFITDICKCKLKK